MSVVFTTVAPSKVKSMDAVFLYDYKNYNFSCEACGWSGNESDVDVVTKIHTNMICCPDCKNDDIRIVNDLSKAV